MYNSKLNDLLCDTSTYRVVNGDLTLRTQNSINGMISDWLKKGYIYCKESRTLKSYNSVCPKMYGMLKLHKENMPMRPIVSNINAPTFKVAKFLSEIINKILGCNLYHVRDSWSFCNFIRGVKVPAGYIMVSFDVISLFTNTPVDLVIKAIENRWDEIESLSPLPKTEFVSTMKLILNTTYFSFNNTIYKQNFGTAMGSSLSVVAANLVMEMLENEVVPQCGNVIHVYKRYVDDCFLVVRAADVSTILSAFNNFHPRLQFTCEREHENTIHFLDLSLHRQIGGVILYSWYTKNIASFRYLQYDSVCGDAFKRNTVVALVDRALRLSHIKYRSQNIEKVYKILKLNKYPESIIKRITRQRVHKLYNGSICPMNNDNSGYNRRYFSMPYIHGLTPIIKRVIERQLDIIVSLKDHSTLRSLYTSLKDKVPTGRRSEVIYKIKCKNCPAIYYGQTKNWLETRIKRHQRDVTRGLQCTALSAHASTLGHVFDFVGTSIVDSESNLNKRLTLEAIYIKTDNNSINNRIDLDNINRTYDDVLPTTCLTYNYRNKRT